MSRTKLVYRNVPRYCPNCRECTTVNDLDATTIRYVSFSEEPSWNAFSRKVEQFFGIPRRRVAMIYTDSDGDDVTISTTEEFEDFKEYSNPFKRAKVALRITDLGPLRALSGEKLSDYYAAPSVSTGVNIPRENTTLSSHTNTAAPSMADPLMPLASLAREEEKDMTLELLQIMRQISKLSKSVEKLMKKSEKPIQSSDPEARGMQLFELYRTIFTGKTKQ